jgi:hypothetical protein
MFECKTKIESWLQYWLQLAVFEGKFFGFRATLHISGRWMRRSPRRESTKRYIARKSVRRIRRMMYIIGGHMDGIGCGEAANDDGSGTALVMEVARVNMNYGAGRT